MAGPFLFLHNLVTVLENAGNYLCDCCNFAYLDENGEPMWLYMTFKWIFPLFLFMDQYTKKFEASKKFDTLSNLCGNTSKPIITALFPHIP